MGCEDEVLQVRKLLTISRGTIARTVWAAPVTYGLILEILVPSMLTPAISPCWLKMKA